LAKLKNVHRKTAIFKTENLDSKPQSIEFCNLLIKFHSSKQDLSAVKNIPKEHLQWVKQMAKRSAVDSLLMYRDEFMEDPNHYRIMVPNDIQLQRHLLKVYLDSPVGMHRGREATYGSLSYDFYWRNMAKHVRNWIRRCPACIKFKSTDPKHEPMKIRIYDCPFNTIGIDYVGQLHEPCLMMYSCSMDFQQSCKVIKEENGSMQYYAS